ncbi:uncharacterized protein LOC144115642 isoform X1 [Amblyomma americanum]
MKASVSEILKEAESVKSALAEDNPRNARAFHLRTRLCWLLEGLLLTDLEFALDKKVEQELWNSAFRNPIAAFQAKSADKKERANGESQTMLAALLETASGFYLQLFRKLCFMYDISFKCHLKDPSYGILHLDKHGDLNVEKPKKSSVLYICQHCLVHLGDIARYRGQSLQAENFYRHAVEMGPRNGHPYNQLALLEAASGEKLSAVFFHVRSLALQHPFPAAATNLSKLFSKMVSDSCISIGKSKMTPYEYTTAFLQFHAHIYLLTDMSQAEGVLGSLTSCLPALVMVEKLETWQLLQMVAICMFNQEHCTQVSGSTDSSTAALQKKAQHLLLDLVASMLHAFLLPMHALQEPRDMRDCCSVPVVKPVLDWLVHKQELLHSEPFVRKPQIWHGFCKLLNALRVVLPAEFPKDKYFTVPLPEDWELQCFMPLFDAHSELHFESAPTLMKKEAGDLRASRLLDIAEVLSQVIMNGKNVISLSKDTPARYVANHYTEAMRNQVMKQIQQLSIEPEGDSRKSAIDLRRGALQKRDMNKSGSSEGAALEVRFKLDGDKTGEPEKRGPKGMASMKERRPGRNVAMQAIFQQREQRSASLADSHSGRRDASADAVSTSTVHNIHSRSSHKTDEKPWYHQAQLLPHNLVSSNGNRGNFRLPNPTNGQPLNGPTAPLTFDPGVAPMPPPQSQQLFGMIEGGGQQAAGQQNPSFVPGGLAGLAAPGVGLAAPGVGPSYLWNYYVPQPMATPGAPQPAPLLYLGTGQPMASHQLESLLRQQQQHQQQQQQLQQQQLQQQQQQQLQQLQQQLQQQQLQEQQADLEPNKMASGPDLFQGNPVSAMATPPSQPPWVPPHTMEVNGCEVVPPGGAAQTSGSDLPTNTYSLFNSPWPSGLHHMSKEGGKSPAGAIDPMVMHSRIQSLWSGPGPSPLERLLEQQKLWRDGAAQ